MADAIDSEDTNLGSGVTSRPAVRDVFGLKATHTPMHLQMAKEIWRKWTSASLHERPQNADHDWRPAMSPYSKNEMEEIMYGDLPCRPPLSSYLVGIIGGIEIGLTTGFFKPERIYRPINTPFTPFNSYAPELQKKIRSAIIISSTTWKVIKRAWLSTLLFVVWECDFQTLNSYHPLIGSVESALLCGTVFGLRGGVFGVASGTVAFAALPIARELIHHFTPIKMR